MVSNGRWSRELDDKMFLVLYVSGGWMEDLLEEMEWDWRMEIVIIFSKLFSFSFLVFVYY